MPRDIVWPNDVAYNQARQDENARIDVHPSLIAYCQSPADVTLCIHWAKRSHKQVAIRSGGHDYEGFSLNNGGLVVDMSQYRDVAIAADKKSVEIFAGTDLATMYHELARSGLTLPGGASSSVAVAGLTTGGGYGLLNRRFGLMCDKLRRVKMVDANGRLRDSAADRVGEEMLWACQGGGGGSFGVVTSMEFEPLPVPDPVTYYSWLWKWDDDLAGEILLRWFDWSKAAPRELTSILTLAGGSPKTVRTSGLFLGDRSRLEKLLQQLAPGVQPKHAMISSLSYIEAIDAVMGGKSARQSWKMKSSFGSSSLNAEAVRLVVQQFAQMPPAVTCLLEFDAFGGVVNDVASTATAFPHRSMSYLLQYQTYWNRPAAAAPAFAWIRGAFDAIDPHTSRKSYRNYCDLDLRDWQSRYFAKNYPKLQAIKTRLDPDNIFRFAQSIELAHETLERV